MTLADLPVLNPSTPAREAKRAAIVAVLFGVFGVLYALARAAAVAPPAPSATDPVFGFAYPKGWGVVPGGWSGPATWPTRLAAADMGNMLLVLAVLVLAVALVIIMHPDILSRQGPQYVSPARRILTVTIALLLSFVAVLGVNKIEAIFGSQMASDPDRARRQLIGYAALALILFGGIWSFIGPKDFGRRIPLRIQHGAMGGVAVWGAIVFATMLSSAPRSFLTSGIDTYYTLFTLDAAGGNPGATMAWAITTDALTAAVAMAAAGALLVVTAPQSLGPGNRRGSALIVGILAAFLALVSLTTYGQTKERARAVNYNVTEQIGLDREVPMRVGFLLSGGHETTRNVYREPVAPSAVTGAAEDCVHAAGPGRSLPAASLSNVQKLGAWLDSHGSEVSGASIRVATCRAALQALRWDVEGARATLLLSQKPERSGAMLYQMTAPNVSSARPAQLSQLVAALGDNARYEQGPFAPSHLADLARIAGDSQAEATWRQRVVQVVTQSAMTALPARAAYKDGSVSGHVRVQLAGWRIGLIAAPDPTFGGELIAPRNEGGVLANMVTATDVAADGRFSFTGLRDGYYALALLGPEGSSARISSRVNVKGDPGVFRLDAQHKAKDVGTIEVTF
ncbi:MAG: hypothetical protein ACHQU1_02425 [Gemmatimonadales bacterium]